LSARTGSQFIIGEDMGGSRMTCRESMHAGGEHTKPTQKGCSINSNQDPSCFEATVPPLSSPYTRSKYSRYKKCVCVYFEWA